MDISRTLFSFAGKHQSDELKLQLNDLVKECLTENFVRMFDLGRFISLTVIFILFLAEWICFLVNKRVIDPKARPCGECFQT